MIHFLDFDRTLFDTDAYAQSLIEEPGCASFKEELRAVFAQRRDDTLTGGVERTYVWNKVTEAFRSGTLSFPKGYLAKFLYQDVAEHLRNMGNEAIVVTFGEQNRQQKKIESALADIVRLTVLYTDTKNKAEYLASWPGYYGQEAIFVDDRPIELEALSSAFPNLKLFEMRRDGKAGDGRFSVIHSLSELP